MKGACIGIWKKSKNIAFLCEDKRLQKLWELYVMQYESSCIHKKCDITHNFVNIIKNSLYHYLLYIKKKLNRCYGKYFSGINIRVSLSSLSVCLLLRNAALLTPNSTNQTDQEKKRLKMDGLEIEGLERGDWRGRVCHLQLHCWTIRESENTSADFVPKLGFFADFLWREKKRCCNRLGCGAQRSV